MAASPLCPDAARAADHQPTPRPRGAGRIRRSRAARSLALVLVALCLQAAWSTPAFAHAELSGTEPASGSVQARTPRQVVLRFTEAVSVEDDAVRVLDASARRYELGPVTVTGTTATAPVLETLPDGGYLVAWRAVSADGHPIHGAFQFSVGVRTAVDPGLAGDAFGASSDRRDEVLGAVLRVIAYLAMLVSSGVVLVGTVLRRRREPSPVSHRVGALAAVGVLALVAQVPIRAALATGRGWGSVTEAGVLGRSLGDGTGWALALSAGGLVLVAVSAGLPFQRSVRIIACTGAALAPLGFALSGHTRTMDPRWVGYAADGVHLAAAAVWFGGLVSLLGVVRARRGAGDVTGAAEAVATFSGVAAAVLVAVAVSGGLLGYIEVGGLDPLRTTTYGRLLMAKVAVVALVVAAGGWNRLRLLPALDRAGPAEDETDVESGAETDPGTGDDETAVVSGALTARTPPGSDPVEGARWATFTRIVRLEVALLVVVVGITGVLVNVTPARNTVVAEAVTAELGDGTATVTAVPGRAGANQVHLVLTGPDGRPDDRYDSADVSFSLPALDMGPLEGTTTLVAPGHFVANADLTIAGQWVVEVAVQPDRFTRFDAEVTLRIR